LSITKEKLAEILGKGDIVDEQSVLDSYKSDVSFARPLKPRLVVKPRNVEQVKALVKWANETRTGLIPVSSGPPHFRGDTVPAVPGAVMVDMREMNKVIYIDRRNRIAIIEPGVTYTQLQPALAAEGLRISPPLSPRANKSVLASLLEREPVLVESQTC